MLKIGEFSRLSQVTVKALHHYDDLGLLHPAHIDPTTGYRYYTLEQLPRLHRIMALKELGLSLEQIGLMLDEEVPTEQIRGMLRLRRAEIQQRLREDQKQLTMLEFRLKMIEAEDNFPELDVVIKQLEPVRVLSMMRTEQHQDRDAVARAIRHAIDVGYIKYTGIGMDVLHGNDIWAALNLNFSGHELMLVVEDDQPGDVIVEGVGVFVLRDEPGIETAATLMLHGGQVLERFEKIALLQRWAVAHSYKLCGLMRALAHRGPLETPNRAEWMTEIQLVVEPAS